jgi:hypothetical protein
MKIPILGVKKIRNNINSEDKLAIGFYNSKSISYFMKVEKLKSFADLLQTAVIMVFYPDMDSVSKQGSIFLVIK